MTWRTKLSIAIATGLGLSASSAAAEEPFLPQTIPVAFDSADPDNIELGELIYRGGVEIEPGEEEVGSISGLDWSDGQLYAVTSDGRWLIMLPDAIQNRLTDIVEIEMGDLLDERGKRLRGDEKVMASSIERSEDGGWLVKFDGKKRIWRYADLHEAAAPHAAAVHPALAELNAGEALETEQYVATGSDCASNGVCYVLLRRGTAETGFGVAIHAVGPDGNGERLAAWGPELTVGNFEALAVREESGLTYLYIASDNGAGADDQRTLVMKFEVSARAATTPGVGPKVYATELVELETELGTITISLETERAPITATNFLRYVDEGRFDGIKCYRALHVEGGEEPSGFLQCGAQNDPKRLLPPIAHEPTSETGLSHTNGALSMARFDPGTATGDFSIMIRDQRGLDAWPEAEDPARRPGFAVFGYVVDGMEVVHAIHAKPRDPDKGEGFLKGQLLAEPAIIKTSRKVEKSTTGIE
ncbi:peptidylprolyl isomerase [Erythrobacter sp. HA6-11]